MFLKCSKTLKKIFIRISPAEVFFLNLSSLLPLTILANASFQLNRRKINLYFLVDVAVFVVVVVVVVVVVDVVVFVVVAVIDVVTVSMQNILGKKTSWTFERLICLC